MASRPIANGNISFGLVSIPVKLFSATRSKSVSFNLFHAKDQSRIQQKIYCPVDDAIVDRSELVRGYEVEKGRYVTFSDEELKQLEARDDHSIEIIEFLPLAEVDPVYFEESYYLGAESGQRKPTACSPMRWRRAGASRWAGSSCAARSISCCCGRMTRA